MWYGIKYQNSSIYDIVCTHPTTNSQVNCVKKDEVIDGKFISQIYFPNCVEVLFN
jgi:hypothetical protein